MRRVVRIQAIDHGIPLSCSDPPEKFARIISVLAHAEQVDLQGHIDLFAVSAQLRHLFLVNVVRSRKPDHIRMGKIEKSPSLQRLPGLSTVPPQIVRIVRPLPAKRRVDPVPEIVLSEDQIFNGIGLKKPQKGLPERVEIFHLQSQMNFNIIFVLPLQIKDRVHIALKLRRQHFNRADISTGIHLRRVVRKAKDLQARLNGIFNVFSLCAVSMAAAPCMCVIVSDHRAVSSVRDDTAVCTAPGKHSRPAPFAQPRKMQTPGAACSAPGKSRSPVPLIIYFNR